MSAEWLATAGLLALAWLWLDGLKKRELAVKAARRVCDLAGVQLLDDSVALHRLALRRNARQQIKLYREYAFEYSDTGDNRLPGRVYLLGEEVLDVNLLIFPAGTG